MKVIFLEPLWPPDKMWGIYHKGAGLNTFSHGLASLAASVRLAGHEVSALNPIIERMDEKSFISWFQGRDYDLVGIPCYTPSANYVFYTAKLVKQILPRVKIVIGGPHATILPDVTLKECPDADFILVGEAEKSLVSLLDTLYEPSGWSNILGLWYRGPSGDLHHTKPTALGKDLDSLPAPAFDLFPSRNYDAAPHFIKKLPTFSLIASRGCPFKCAFCAASQVGGRQVRYHSPERLLEQMEELKKSYGAKGFIFYDSTFTLNKKWVYEFCEGLLKHNLNFPWVVNTRVDTIDEKMMRLMKRAGCWCLNMGLESANQSSLDLLKKGTTVAQNKEVATTAMKIGFKVMATYILALPGETRRDVERTIDFAMQLKSHITFFFLPVPYPKTLLFDICMNYGGLRKGISWDDFTTTSFDRMVYINPNFTKEELLSLHGYAFKTYYRDIRVLFRNLKTLTTLDQLKSYLSIGRVIRRFVFSSPKQKIVSNPRPISCSYEKLCLNTGN